MAGLETKTKKQDSAVTTEFPLIQKWRVSKPATTNLHMLVQLVVSINSKMAGLETQH